MLGNKLENKSFEFLENNTVQYNLAKSIMT